MHVVVPVVIAIAALAWGSAVVHAFMLFGHRRAGVSGARLLFSGIAWLHRDNFEPGAWGVHRRFVISFVSFFVAVFGAAAAGALVGAVGR